MPTNRKLEKIDIYLDPDYKEWVRRHSRAKGFHTITAYIRFLLVQEREKSEGREDKT